MKHTLVFLLAITGLLSPLRAQQFIVAGDTVTENPLANAGQLFDSKELAIVWYERNPNNDTYPMYHQIFDYQQNPAGTIPVDQALSAKPLGMPSGQQARGARRMDVAAGNFNGDRFQEYVAAWTSQNGTQISLYIPKIDPSNLNPSGGTTYQVPVSMATSDNALIGKLRVLAGDLDGDGTDEIVLAYRTTGSNGLTLRTFSVRQDPSGPFIFTPRSNFDVFNLVANQNLEPFDLALVDLDMDGRKEIAVAGFRQPPSGAPTVSLVIYKMDSATQTLQAKAVNHFRNDIPASTRVTVNIVGGDFDQKLGDELAISVHIPGTSNSGQTLLDSRIYLMRVGDRRNQGAFDLLEEAFFSITDVLDREYSNNVGTSQGINAFDLEAGDIDGDGRDELVIGRIGQFNVLKYTDGVGWVDFANASSFGLPDLSYSYNFLAVGDMDNDRKAEIVFVQDWRDESNFPEQYKLSINIYRWNGSALEVKASNNSYRSISTGQSEPRRFAITLGDFDGDRVRIGQGRRYVKTKIVQPLVILNAPPVHFDILGPNTVDLNRCYNGQACDFRSIYKTSVTTDSLVTASVERAWGVSTSLSAGGSFAGIGASASLTAKYGEKFSRSGTRKRTFTISQQTVAKEDDWIYATVTDYIIWEYPVFEAGASAGHLISLTPVLTENRWFDSKSWSAYTYQPDHEVGNILSYRAYSSPTFLDNPSVAQPIRANATADALTISINSDHEWNITTQSFAVSGASRVREIGLEVGASVSGWGVSVGVNGTYSQTAVSTHTTSVNRETSLTVELKGVDPAVPEARYIVTPYMYWGANGALTLDYAVRPEEAAPGGTNTFWDANYKNQPDPAFILPWKYDPEKGFALQDPQKRYQTKSIFLDPIAPQPGDIVTITAYVHNWSLLPTNGPVSVGFYIGHPNQGGAPMTNLAGQQTVSTNGPIMARGREKVTFQWQYDGNTTRFPRIYGYIDPGQQHVEIHENNNIGFVVLEVQGNGNPPLSIDPPLKGVNWVQAYPNPFQYETRLRFELDEATEVSAELLDLQGRIMAHTKPGYLYPGEHEIELRSPNLSPGIYLYRVHAGGATATGKLICRP